MCTSGNAVAAAESFNALRREIRCFIDVLPVCGRCVLAVLCSVPDLDRMVPDPSTPGRHGDNRADPMFRGQRMKPSNSSFAQAIDCLIDWPDCSLATMPAGRERFQICTAMSGGAEEPAI
jgi:hypothetical protein